MRDLENYHLSAMVSAPPGEDARTARDHHHVMLHALRELAEQLVLYVTAAVEARESLKEDAQNPDPDNLDGDMNV